MLTAFFALTHHNVFSYLLTCVLYLKRTATIEYTMSNNVRGLPIGQQLLPDIINQNYIYVDKTSYIFDLINGKRYYFLSRPRRFGKTLLLSTLSEIFQGKKDLFTSLAISRTDYSWEQYPVVTLSFATMAVSSAEILRKALSETLETIAQHYGVETTVKSTLGIQFKSLILNLAKKSNSVVILIDEYDATILKNIENLEEAEKYRDVLGEFYSALKDVEVDKHIRFVFTTGITKFSKTSIFSGLNHLQDISLDPRTASLLGYTSNEITHYFQEHLDLITKKTDKSLSEILKGLTYWYNGYQFVNPLEVADSKVYNPYSVMLYLQNQRFDNYWFDTGTPTFLIKLLKKEDYSITAIEGSKIHWDETKSFELDAIELVPLLFQAGYLTIDTYNQETENFSLTFPNQVKTSFFQIIVLTLTKSKKHKLSPIIVALKKAINADLESFFTTLERYLAQIPYHMHIDAEKHYQALFFGLLTLIGAKVRVEEPTSNGRIDAVIKTDSHIYVIEFKLNDTAEFALKQIKKKE